MGELYRRTLISDNIIQSVFELLMAVEDPNESQKEFINDDTLEGAVNLMTKIGYLIDKKILEKGTPKKEEVSKKFNLIFEKFTDYATSWGTLRIKLLIKNMQDN